MTNNDNINTIIGAMSGTSLDGLDLAACTFNNNSGKYQFKVLAAETYPYNDEMRAKLSGISNDSAFHFNLLNKQFGQFVAEKINLFTKKFNVNAQAIASHGHTIFHQPEIGFTTQIGCGATIAAVSNLTTVCDFRSMDVALGGQGAPLVPIGDELLFSEFQSCLNLGGIANISFSVNGKKLAFDVCVCNMVFNFLATKLNKQYDENGSIAKSGIAVEQLLNYLNNLAYYRESKVKSLGYEWFEKNILSVLKQFENYKIEDVMATFAEHVAIQIANVLNKENLKSVLVTGGGAFNSHLIALIKQKTNADIIIPSSEIINFKEAVIFAFLGYLRLNETINTLASVTGAKKDSIGGAVYYVKH